MHQIQGVESRIADIALKVGSNAKDTPGSDEMDMEDSVGRNPMEIAPARAEAQQTPASTTQQHESDFENLTPVVTAEALPVKD